MIHRLICRIAALRTLSTVFGRVENFDMIAVETMMHHWVLKAATQRAIGAMPNPHFWNEMFQRVASRSLDLTDDKFLDKLARTRRHLDNHQRLAADPSRLERVVEIGTGWFPVASLALWLCGAGEVRTYDITRHLTPERLAATIDAFRKAYESGVLQQALPRLDAGRMARLEALASAEDLEEALDGLGIHYRVCPFSACELEAGSVDLLFTTAVLEYFETPALVDLLAETLRVLSPTGLESHWIDLADEFAYFDSRLSPLNFLRFSSAAWRVVNNPLIPLSRLRLSDYRAAFAAAGLAIAEEDAERAPAELTRVPVAAEFRRYSDDDLLGVSVWFSAAPAAPVRSSQNVHCPQEASS